MCCLFLLLRMASSPPSCLLIPCFAQSCEAQEQVSGVCRRDLVSALERLRVRDDLSSAEMLDILGALQQNLGSEAQVSEVLALLPDAYGGLYRIAMGLYHSHAQVRRASMEVLLKIRASKVWLLLTFPALL